MVILVDPADTSKTCSRCGTLFEHLTLADRWITRSSLLMLVSAFGGSDLIRHAYAEAVRLGYRFYSFGDAMLIL